MIVTLKNTQKIVRINVGRAKQILQLLMKYSKIEGWNVGVWFAGNQTIRKLNSFHRGKDKPTDIISFPFHGKLRLYRLPLRSFNGVRELGDLVLGMPHIKDECKKHGMKLEDQMLILLTHGFCHLLGYDHEKDNDFRSMRKAELKMLRFLKENGIEVPDSFVPKPVFRPDKVSTKHFQQLGKDILQEIQQRSNLPSEIPLPPPSLSNQLNEEIFNDFNDFENEGKQEEKKDETKVIPTTTTPTTTTATTNTNTNTTTPPQSQLLKLLAEIVKQKAKNGSVSNQKKKEEIDDKEIENYQSFRTSKLSEIASATPLSPLPLSKRTKNLNSNNNPNNNATTTETKPKTKKTTTTTSTSKTTTTTSTPKTTKMPKKVASESATMKASESASKKASEKASESAKIKTTQKISKVIGRKSSASTTKSTTKSSKSTTTKTKKPSLNDLD